MKTQLFLLSFLFFAVAGCAPTSNSVVQPQDMPVADSADAKYQKLYYDYRALVTTTINSNDEANLGRVTDDYIRETGKSIFLITVSQLDPSGKWNVLLHKTAPDTSINLPKINYGGSQGVNIHNNTDFVLCESGRIAGHYKNAIYIRIAVKK